MSEAHADIVRRRSTPPAFDLRKRLDELARGECSEEEFVRESFERRGAATESAWYVLSLLDQRYRLGQLSDDLFQSIKSRIALRELQSVDFGTTVELVPAPRPANNQASPNTPAPSSPEIHDAALIEAQIELASEPPSEPVATPAALIGASIEGLSRVQAMTPVVPVAPSPSQAPQVLAAGLVLRDRYTLEAAIGSGGMATVFKAIDRCGVLPADADRRVAVKVLRERINQKPAILIQLRREFYCTQVLSHPNIVKVYELDRDRDLAFYTMELLEGERLSDLLARAQSQPLPRRYAWEVIRAVGSAVAHAHSRNVIHGDLKPQNVMVTHKSEVRVLDFGSSRTSSGSDAAASDSSNASGPLAATPPYACCEILEGQQPDPRDDLYALACVAYELLTGSHPFQLCSSIEARAAGARPQRPAQLSHRQWQALLTGLSWSREHRSVPVNEWLEKLGLSIEPHQLPSLDADERGISLRWPRALRMPRLPRMPTIPRLPRLPSLQRLSRLQPVDWPTIALPASLTLLAIVALFAYHREPPQSPSPLPIVVKPLPIAVAPAAATPTAAVQAPTPPSVSLPSPPPTVAAKVVTRPPHIEMTTAAATKPSISLTSKTYLARRDAHFVEVRVRRTDLSTEGQRFTWWTENGTAKAGADFTAQGRINRVFSGGRQFATLFIRVNPTATRREAGTFYVNIAEPGMGTQLGAVTRAAVVLPAMP
jgi:serine/threonine protein kinase